MFNTKHWANIAKFYLMLISLVQTEGIINHLKCKLIIVNYVLAWSASNSNVFFCIYLDIFRITFFPTISQTEEYVLICTDTWQSPLTWFPWLLPSYFILNSNFWGCSIYELHFQKDICKKLYLMSKLLRFLLYCFKCNKLYFSKNEQLYLLATNRLIFKSSW